MNLQGLIKVNGKNRALNLPFSIGRSAKNAVLIVDNSENPVYAWITVHDGLLRAFHPESGEELKPSDLRQKGVILLGVTSESNSPVKNLLAWERQLQLRLPAALSALLMHNLPQGVRFIGYVVALFGIILLSEKEHAPPSNQPSSELSVAVGQLKEGITDKTIYASQHRAGVVFEVNVGSNEAEKPSKITFHLGGMSSRGGIEVIVNDQTLYRSPVIEDCIEFACPQEVIVQPQYINTGANRVAFRHSDPAEKWILYDIKFQSYRPMNMLEQRRFHLYLEEAADLFEKRDISPYNLISSGRILRKVKKFTRTLYLNATQRTSFEVLDKEVKKHIDDFLKTFWFNNERKISIGYLKEAQDDLMELSRYFPDAASVQGKKIEKQLDRIHTMMGDQ